MLRRRALVTAVLGLLALGELATGAAAAVHQRAVEAQRVAEHRAEVAYRAGLGPLVLRVFDAVQPVQDVADAFATLSPGLLAARNDVISHGGGVEELHAVTTALHALHVPARFRQQAQSLDQGLQQLTAALTTLVGATHDPGDKTGQVEAFGSGFDGLLEAESTWEVPVTRLGFPIDLPVPWAGRTHDRGRHEPTQGGFIQASDLACGKADLAVRGLPRTSAVQMVLSDFPKEAAIVRTEVRSLRAAKAPASAAAFAHRLDLRLQAAARQTALLDRLSSALHRGDAAGYQAGVAALPDFLSAMREVSAAYASVGVTGCADFFSVDDSGRPGTRAPLKA